MVMGTPEVHAPGPLGGRFSRRSILLTVLAAALIALAIVLLVRGGDSAGDSHAKTAAVASRKSPGSAVPSTVIPPRGEATGTSAGGTAGGKRVNASEVADPEEARSFPSSGSVHHKAASTPSKASDQIVAAGAPSDAEVKKELAQMQSVERTAKQAQSTRLTPIAGGNSSTTRTTARARSATRSPPVDC